MVKILSVIKPDGSVTTLSLETSEVVKGKIKVAWALKDLPIKGEDEASDYFNCLLKVRETLEKYNLKIVCNGARYDVYPSRMSRQMGKGIKAYVLTKGLQASEKDLVDIFEEENPAKTGTIEQQKNYYNNWLESLR